MINPTKKVTLATVKSFVRKNAANLYIKCISRFDGMQDGVRSIDGSSYRKVNADAVNLQDEYRLGIEGAWFVRDSRDYFNVVDQDGFQGYEITNCCGNFLLVIPKVA